MTATQRVDVERFDPCLTPESDDIGLRSITADMEIATFGEYVRYSDYAALLQKIDQLHDDLSTARQSLYECAGQRNDALSSLADAERARDEACGLLRDAQGNLYHPHEPAMIDSLEARIAAFLAANGGRDE